VSESLKTLLLFFWREGREEEEEEEEEGPELSFSATIIDEFNRSHLKKEK
jgi:hypothetical protein